MADGKYHFDFTPLKNGTLNIGKAYGAFLVESAEYCLKLKSHPSPVSLLLTGDLKESGLLDWGEGEQNGGQRPDLYEATEYGACGLALVIALQLTGMPFVEQSARGTGGDYWLGNDRSGNVIFQRAARLEVSGILQGDVSSPLAEGLCKRKRRLGPRWPWSRFQFGTTRQKRRCGIFLFVLSEQDNREVQRLDLPPHVVHL